MPWCMTFVFFRLMISLNAAQALEKRSRRACSSFSLCATRVVSSTKRRSRSIHLRTLVLARSLAGLNNFPSERVRSRRPSTAEPKACFRRMEKKIVKSVGANTQPCLTPMLMSKASLLLSTFLLRRVSDGRIPKDLLYGELDHGLRPVGRPKLRFKDTCKRDMIEIGLDVENWETLAADRGRWRINCSACLDEGELRIRKEAMARRERRKGGSECSTSFGFRVFWMQSCLQFTNWADQDGGPSPTRQPLPLMKIGDSVSLQQGRNVTGQRPPRSKIQTFSVQPVGAYVLPASDCGATCVVIAECIANVIIGSRWTTKIYI